MRRFRDARSGVLHGRDKRKRSATSRWHGRADGASATNESESAAERPYGHSGGEVEPLGRGLGIVSGTAETNPATYFTWEAAIEPHIGKRGA